MKKPILSLIRKVCTISAIIITLNNSMSQANYWTLPPLKWDMQNPVISNAAIPAATSYSHIVSNGAYDDAGNMLFYVKDNSVYGPTGAYISNLLSYYQTGTPHSDPQFNWDAIGSEIAIVPVPTQCKQYYIVYTRTNSMSSSTCLLYMKIDCTGGTPVLSSPTASPGYAINYIGFFAGGHGGLAVSKLVSASSRYLFMLTSTSVERFTVTSSGIGSQVTTANDVDYPSIFTYATFWMNELELSPDQKYLAWGHTDIGSKLNILEINPVTYAKVAASTYTISNIQGLEFNSVAGVSTRIFVSTTSGGISYVNIGTPGVNTIPASTAYNNTYLELARNGYIFGVNNSGSLGYFDGNASSYSSASIVAAPAGTVNSNNGCPMFANEITYRLNDQIDGELYPTANPTITGQAYACSTSPEVYTLGGNYNSSVAYTWTITGGTPSTYTGTSQTLAITWTSSGGTISVSAGACTTPATFTVLPCCQVTVPGKTTIYLNNVTENTPVAYSGATNVYVINGVYTINASDVTFNNCETYFAANAQVKINSGGFLKIVNGSIWQAGCGAMWNGIIEYAGSNLLVDASAIRDAKLAIDSKGGAPFTLTNGSVLNANYRGILVETFTASTHPGVINNSTISCLNSSGLPANCLITPYVGKRSYSGIEVNDVAQLNIGLDAAGQTNTFYNMDKAIISMRTGLRVYNNNFMNITYTGVGLGRCIISSNNASPAPEKLVVIGGTNNIYQKNTFTNSTFGVFATNNQDLAIVGNTFTNLAEAANILYCKGADNQLDFNSNIINDCSWGLHAVGNEGSKTFNVISNVINSTIVTPKPNSTGISADNGVLSSATAPVLNINSNTINSVLTGIKVTNFTAPNIRLNNIYSLSDLGSSVYANGIATTTCPSADIESNVVQGTGAGNWWQNGIHVESCANSKVLYNSVENIGRGFFFGGSCSGTETAKNHMLNNLDGFLLNYAVTGYQLGSAFACRATENKWEGSFTNHLYSYYSDGAQSLHYLMGSPVSTTVPGGSMNPIGLTSTVYPATGYSAIPVAGCTAPSGYKLAMDPKLAQWVEIAKDETHYPVYSETAKWTAQYALYNMIETDSTLKGNVDLNDFLNGNKNSNIAKLNQVNDMLASGEVDLMEAGNILNSVSVKDDAEKNLKIVMEILISSYNDHNLSDDQLSGLRKIAALCPYEAGHGVYNARVLLSTVDGTVYINECEIATLSKQAEQNTFAPDNENDIAVLPNPNNGSFQVSFDNNDVKNVYVYDLMGKCVFAKGETMEKILDIDLSKLPGGVFVIKVVTGDTVQTKQIISQ